MAYASKSLTRDEADTLLQEIRDRYDVACDAWQRIHELGNVNLKYCAGDPWDPDERKRREEAKRPCISLDEITQHTNQVINDVRSNRRGVKFSPNGRGASEKTAELYQNKMREVEYRSDAQVVYTTAFQNAVERNVGYVRLKAKWKDTPGQRFLQELWLEEVVNPDTILPDPDAKRPTFIDQKFCFVHEVRTIPEFKREFSEAKIQSFDSAMQGLAPKWIRGDQIVVAEYWSVKMHARELALVQAARNAEPQEVWANQLTKAQLKTVVQRREVQTPEVCSYLTNGVEILGPKQLWKGKFIPILACTGKILYLDEGSGVERKILGMVDLMRDPQMLYAYLRTNECEVVGMTPKTPYIGYEGQFRGHEDDWASVNTAPKSHIEARGKTEETGDQLLPLPQRQLYEPPIQALEILAESAIRSIRSAAGSTPLPSAAARRSEKSGVALKRIEDIAAMGSYHLKDHYKTMIQDVGVVFEDAFEGYYDTARDLTVRLATAKDNDTQTVRINDPRTKDAVNVQGDHLVTVSEGPSFESEQEAGSDLADSLMGIGDPEILRAVLPLAVKLKNQGVIGDELVEILKQLQPPSVRMLDKAKQQDPAEMVAQLGQMQEQLQLAEQAMAQLAKDAEGKQLDAFTKRDIAQMEDATKRLIAERQAEIDLEKARLDLEKTDREIAARIHIAEIGARTKGVQMLHEAEHEAIAMGHEHAEAELDRAAARAGMDAGQAHEAAMQDVGATTASDEAERQRAFDAEQAAQAAAIEPEV